MMYRLSFPDHNVIEEMHAVAHDMIPYCPYSNYPVVASVLTTEGDVYGGANYEVVSFNQCMHAEHSAITAALNARPSKEHRIIDALFVSTLNGGAPCGHCRQIIAEYAAHPDVPIFIEQPDLSIKEVMLSQLLPEAFDSLKS